MENINQGKKNSQIKDSWKTLGIGFVGLFVLSIFYLIFSLIN